VKHLLKEIRGIDYAGPFPRMPYSQAMAEYGIDKPDIRFDMKLRDLTNVVKVRLDWFCLSFVVCYLKFLTLIVVNLYLCTFIFCILSFFRRSYHFQGKGFALFDNAELVTGFCVAGKGASTNNEIKKWTELAKSKDIGGTGLIWVKTTATPSSSVDKFYKPEVGVETEAR
jgi:aspartyl-tRNA synthetase